MANPQGGARRSQPAPRSARRGSSAEDVERDENYDLVSVLYHALQGVETCGQYIADAADDDELSQFFEHAREAQAELADRAKLLLAARLAELAEDDDADGEEED